MNTTNPSRRRPVSSSFTLAALIATGAFAVACGPAGNEFSMEDAGLPNNETVVDGATPPPPPSAEAGADASLAPPGDAAPSTEAGNARDAGEDAAHDGAAPSADASDASAPEDAAPPPADAAPPVDAAEAGPVVCAPGTADCDGDPGADCETKIASDPRNCGACGHDCTRLPHVSGAVSCGANGACVVPPASCQSGFAHCSSNPDDGCETDLSQPGTCGSCTTSCSGATPDCSPNGTGGYGCSSGCPSSAPTRCGNTCVDTTSDPSHCGSCTTNCGTGAPPDSVPTCSAQGGQPTCGFTCDATYHACGAACDSNTSIASCGALCTPCTPPANATATCDGTSCGFACDPSYHQCGSACDSNGSTQSCGTSCTACVPPANAQPTCDGTSCGFTCDATYHQCGTACDSNTSTQSCGSACAPCVPPANATSTCDGTSCGFACNAGFCPGVGGESTNTCYDDQTDPYNCGACGHSCAVPGGGTPACVAGACQPGLVAAVTFPAPCQAAPIIVDTDGRVVFVEENTLYGLWGPDVKHPAVLSATANASDIIVGLASDATNYYFTSYAMSGASHQPDPGLVAVSKSGYVSSTLSSHDWAGLALAGTSLYLSDYSGNINYNLDSFALPGGPLTPAPNPYHGTLFRFTNVFGVAADANGAFFAASGGSAGGGAILSFQPGVSIPAVLPAAPASPSAQPFNIALDAQNVYWADESEGGTIHQAARTGIGNLALGRVQGTVLGLTVADGYVYWVTAAGDIMRAAVGSSSPQLLAHDTHVPWGVAVKGTTLYFTNLGGDVWGLALPPS